MDWRPWIDVISSRDWTCRLYVFEVKKSIWCRRLLSMTSFERVHWCCIHIFLGQTVPTVDNSFVRRSEDGLRSDSDFSKISAVTSGAVFSGLWKNSFHGVLEKPLTNLRSVLLRRRSWRDHKPSWRSLLSYGRPRPKLQISENSRVRRCWTRSSSLWHNMDSKQMSSNPDAVWQETYRPKNLIEL